jgi:hypothetical protein
MTSMDACGSPTAGGGEAGGGCGESSETERNDADAEIELDREELDRERCDLPVSTADIERNAGLVPATDAVEASAD